jgi:pimeloyl-ACP methyl ester carboxylesterase
MEQEPTSPIEDLRHIHGENFFYQLYHNEPKRSGTGERPGEGHVYGQPWPLHSDSEGAAEDEYDSDPSRMLRMMYFTGRASSCRQLLPWKPPTVRQKARTAGGWFGRLPEATGFPSWCTAEEFDYYVQQYRRSGFRGGLNYYRNIQRNWELTRHWPRGARVMQPLLFIAGEHDVAVVWASNKGRDGREGTGGAAGKASAPKDVQAAIEKSCKHRCADLRGVVWLEDCGHWVMQEKGDEVSRLVVQFVDGVTTEFDALARIRGEDRGHGKSRL